MTRGVHTVYLVISADEVIGYFDTKADAIEALGNLEEGIVAEVLAVSRKGGGE